MECLTAIGNGVVGKIAEYIVEPVGRQVGYVIYYNRNLKKLQNQVRDLDAARASVEHKIVEEERKGRKVETSVTNWLTDVNKITGEAKDFLKDEHQAKIKCLYGFCPNLMDRHNLSRKSTKLVQEVAELYGQKDFANIAYNDTLEEVCVLSTKDYEACDSRTLIVKNIMDELKNSNTDMIGLYGIGGVGKTTLVKEIYKQATKGERVFEEVVMVLDLKQNPSIERIQKEIVEKLGLNLHEIETPAARALHLCNRIKETKTLVILDDVWESIDLEALGLPCMPTLKILLTSRNRRVLSRDMGTEKEFHLDVLDKKEAWNLFQKMAGDIVKEPDIQTVATQVAENCGGLPLLIVTVARTLKNSPLHTWNDALRRLKRLDGQGLTDKAYSAIEWSYSKLDNEELKSLFLLCATLVWTFDTCHILYLSICSMSLSLLKNVHTIGEAWDAINSLLEQLKDSCLLLHSDDNIRVRMHDLVKDVAKGIASRKQHVLSLSDGIESKEWLDKEFCEKCTMVCLRKCNIPELPDILQCQELTLFLLNSSEEDSSQEIPCNFFKEMKKLRVLDVTSKIIPSLPSSLQFLTNLRMLCFHRCTLGDIALVGQLQNLEFLSFTQSKFKQLPKEIGQLIRLRFLCLSGCSELEVISPGVLSSLKRLEHLRMGNSFNRWEVGRVISTERSNPNLEELKNLHQLTTLQIHIPDANMLPADLFTTKLERFQICIGSAWKWGDVDEAINTLKLHLTTRNELDQGLKMLLNRTEDLYLEGTEGVNNSIVSQLGPEGFQNLKHLHVQNNAEFANVINGKVGFPNLTWLAVSELNGLRFLMSSSVARSLRQLKRLQISGCQIMEAIVSIEESDEEIEENVFCQLQDLELKDLPNLTQFCSSRSYTKMPNPSFERLQLQNSSKPDKFTFDSVNTICEIEESDSKGNHDIVIQLQPFLFDKKEEFPNLKTLFIEGLAKLTTIWNNQLSVESSKNLESIEIVSCESLRSICPASVARGLQQLRRLIVRNSGVEEIISNKDGLLATTPMFVFSKLTYLRFDNLPQFRSFYPGLHTSSWPSLNTLAVHGCDKVQIFAQGKRELYNMCSPNKQSLFVLEKDSFPNLEFLGFRVTENWDSQPLHLFRKLKSLLSYGHSNSSVDSLEKLLGLEKLDVSSNGEIHAVGNGTLLHLRELKLCGMRKLMHLGDDNSRSTCPNFPNLEILVLKECDSLKNLRSSAISFKTLTTLQVSFCKGLKYLVTYSMAKSLMQLTKLEVEDCEEMIEIVESNESDDSGNEIEFRGLKHMKLSALPRLRWFCSGTRMVTFPSLETLSMNCTLLETFIFDPMRKSSTIRKEIEESDSKENFQTMVPHFLFDNKVGFPSLKNLSIKGLSKLTTIWHNQLAPDSFCKLTQVEVHGCGSLLNIFVPSVGGRLNSLHTLSVKECESVRVVFELGEIVVTELHDTPAAHLTPFDCQNLESIEIDSCESLKHIFLASMARGLQQLKRLIVKKCGVEEIIVNEEGQQTTPKFVFSKVTFAEFHGLPKLTSFYPGIHSSSWPSLNYMAVFGCDKVQIFAEEVSSFQEQLEANNLCNSIKPSLFLIEKDSFPNLEHLALDGLEIWNGPLPVQLFSKLKQLDAKMSIVHALPPSLTFLISLQTLCLNCCALGDIALVGQLGTLEFLSFKGSKFKQLPKEIGQLIRLRLLDLTVCSELEVISPNVLSSLKRLEHLRMGNSFNRWEVGLGISTERSNANLEELKNLHQLTALQIHIPDANMLPADLFTTKLERFQICIGSAWKWGDVDEALNTLKLHLTTRNELDQGLKMLLNRTEDLCLEGTEGVNNSIVSQLGPEGFQNLKHLHVQNNAEFANVINGKVGFPNLTWLAVSELNGLRFLMSSSVARSLRQLKRLQISGCQIMEAIVSIEESDEEIEENVFCQLQDLELKDLPNLTQFCSSRSYTKMPNPSFERLQLQNSSKPDKFTFDSVNTICEIEESDSRGNHDIVIQLQPFLFDKKVEFPNLKKLFIEGLAKLTTIWNNQLFVESSKNLESIEIVSCESLKSICPASVARGLQQLRRLIVRNSGVEEIISNKDGLLATTPMFVFSKLTYLRFENLPQLRSFYPGLHTSSWPSLINLGVYGCDKVQIFAQGERELYNMCSPNKQSLFLLEKDSFPNLEVLGLRIMENWDSPSLYLFKKLKTLYSDAHSNSSVSSLEKLFGLEKLKVSNNDAIGNGTLPHLRELQLHGMRKLMHLGDDNSRSTCPNFPNLEILVLKECDSLKNLRSSAISFKTLTTLQVSFCKGLKYLVTYSMAKSLMQLTKLEVEDCEEMIEIVESNESDDSGNEIEFRGLKHMKLSALPRLRWFCSGTRMVTFPSLETLSMNCTLLETFIFDPMRKSSTIRKEIEESDSKENFQTMVPHFLFDNKVGFPSLKNLSIKGLSKLTTIWHNQLAPDSFCKLTQVEVHGCGSLLNIFVPSVGGRLNSLHTLSVKECESVRVVFELGEIVVTELHDTPAAHLTPFDCQNLESIEIDSCESLKHIFLASMARGLQQLKSLIVKKCGVEEIIVNEEGQQTTPKFVFSKVTFAEFHGLPKLTSFYPGIHSSSWPSLNYMAVFGCDKVQIFAEEVSSFQEQLEANNLCNSIKPSLFLIEKDSFPNLERLVLDGLEIWNGSLPVQFFSKLKYLDVASPMSKSVVFLDRLLPDLEGNNQSSAVGMGAQLPHLRELTLNRMYKLMHLGEEEDNSQSARPNFPNLEILHLNGWHSLRILRSSAIPFNNLTSLHVSFCKGLKYLITYSMAKSLIHLTKLEVGYCLRLVEIVGNNEDEDDSGNYEITFRRLKHLKLWILPRLRGFCSRGNCSVKFPSLETLSISNRLKLKIFPTIGDETLQTTNEEEDTDVEWCEGWLAKDDEINSASTDEDEINSEITDEDEINSE